MLHGHRTERRVCTVTNLLAAVVLLLFWLALATASDAQDEDAFCNTRTVTECEKVLMWLVDQRWKQANVDRRRNLASQKRPKKEYTIPVVFHALAQERSDQGTVSFKHQLKLMKSLKVAFRYTPFDFIHQDTITTRNDTWHECNDQSSFIPMLRKGSRNTLNVFLCDSRLLVHKIRDNPPLFARTPIIGRSTFPHELDSFEGGLSRDAVVLRSPAKKFRQAINNLAGLRTKVDKASLLEIRQAFGHEVGHWLGLLHTFEAGCSNRLHSTTYPLGAVGDGVTDTAAEKHSAWSNKGWQSCFKKQGIPDTCTNRQEFVDPGPDPVENYMDYNSPHCTKKNGYFSKVERMQAHYEKYRLGIDPEAGARSDRRMLQAGDPLTQSFVPDDELVTICVASAVKDCDCAWSCYSKFHDLLRDFLPYDKFSNARDQIFRDCSDCETLGSVDECPEGEFCFATSLNRFGARVGYSCSTASLRSEPRIRDFVDSSLQPKVPCHMDTHCLAETYCEPSTSSCAPIPKCQTSRDCPANKVCRLQDKLCSRQGLGRLGDFCSIDEDCHSRTCSAGLCSSCRLQSDNRNGCVKGWKCQLTRASRRFSRKKRGIRGIVAKPYFKCQRAKTKSFGSYKCSTRTECVAFYETSASRNSSAVECYFGECRECPEPGSSVGCLSMHYCDHFYQCSIETWHGGRCFTDDMCAGGLCVDARCGDCTKSGASDECSEDEICWENVCQAKKPSGIVCTQDLQCSSGKCLHGRCYGDCAADNAAAACGHSAPLCVDGFCHTGNMLATQQEYFRTYDCRMGVLAHLCRVCTADWQCQAEQFCSDESACRPKLPEGESCMRDSMCISGMCDPSNNRCADGAECVRNSDCGTDSFCGGFKCQEKRPLGQFCSEHFHCQSLACNEEALFCEGCRDDLSCLQQNAGTPFCVDGNVWHLRTCAECRSSQDCLPHQACDVGHCRDTECRSHFDCPGELFCKFFGYVARCVACLQGYHCQHPDFPVCNLDGTCVKCFPRNGLPHFNDREGFFCDETCTTDDDCNEDRVCDLGHGRKLCVNCIPENNHGCNNETEACRHAETAESFHVFTCQPRGEQVCSYGPCIECDTFNDEIADCAEDMYCDDSLHVCRKKTCVSDEDCRPRSSSKACIHPAKLGSDGDPLLGSDSVCGCHTSEDCAEGEEICVMNRCEVI